MAEGQSQDSQIQNVLFNKTGKLISRSTIRQITKIHRRTIVNDNDFGDMFQGRARKELSPTEYMMTYCRSKKYNFQLLLNDPLFSSEPTSGTYKNDASISTHPGLSMDNSMVIMSLQSDKHVVKTNGKVIRDNQRHCRNYKNNVHDKLATVASSILSTLLNRIKYYETIRISTYVWKIKKKEYNRDRRSYIPDIDIINTVVLRRTADEGVFRMECFCTYTKVFGLPCVHSMVVSKTFKPHWNQIIHYDISVRWWKK